MGSDDEGRSRKSFALVGCGARILSFRCGDLRPEPPVENTWHQWVKVTAGSPHRLFCDACRARLARFLGDEEETVILARGEQ